MICSISFGTDITPDKEILVDEELFLDCSLHNTTIEHEKKIYQVNSSLIEFKFNKKVYGGDRVRLITPQVARYHVPRATVNDTGTYYCMLKYDLNQKSTLVCLSHIKVGCKLFFLMHCMLAVCAYCGDKPLIEVNSHPNIGLGFSVNFRYFPEESYGQSMTSR